MDASEFQFELFKVQTLVDCLDDKITAAVTNNPSEAGEQAIFLIDFLQEYMDSLIANAEHFERSAT